MTATEIRGRNNPLICECDGVPSADQFRPGGVLGLTLPYLMIERTTRALYSRDSSGAVVQVLESPLVFIYTP